MRALVTGCGRRLGFYLCEQLVAAGWQVTGSYRSERAELAHLRALGVELVQADFAVEGEVARLATALGAHDDLALIIHNASAFEPDSGLNFETDAALKQLGVNLIAPLDFARLLAKQPQDGADRCAIHILDQKVFNLNPDYFSYTLSKLALERAVALQAQALAPLVRVSAIAPGLVYVSGPQTGDNFRRASQVNLLRSPTDPEDVARTAVFLAENASITGITVTVDKGQHLVPMERDVMFVAEQLASTAPLTNP